MEESKRLQLAAGSENAKLRALQEARRKLPAYQQRQEICGKLAHHSVVVVSGSTGGFELQQEEAIEMADPFLSFLANTYFALSIGRNGIESPKSNDGNLLQVAANPRRFPSTFWKRPS